MIKRKMIAEAIKIILETGRMQINQEGRDRIANVLYGKTDTIKNIRLRNVLDTKPVRDEIAMGVTYYLAKEGIGDNTIVKLIKQAMGKAKSTKDYLDVVRMLCDLQNSDKINVRTTKKIDLVELQKGIEGKATITEVTNAKKDRTEIEIISEEKIPA